MKTLRVKSSIVLSLIHLIILKNLFKSHYSSQSMLIPLFIVATVRVHVTLIRTGGQVNLLEGQFGANDQARLRVGCVLLHVAF